MRAEPMTFFFHTEMGLFQYQFLGLNRPLCWGQIRPCEGSIWKTAVPFWNFKWPKQPSQILAFLQMTPQNRANSAPCWATSEAEWSFLFLQTSSPVGK